MHIGSLFLTWLDQLIFAHRVEFEDVHRLADGQVKHSTEVFYAGSLWKVSIVVLNVSILVWSKSTKVIGIHVQVSVQAFNDEDPHGRRTLGILFLFTMFSYAFLLL